MLDFWGETKRVKSFAYGLPHLGSPGIHNLDTLVMKCDSNFTIYTKTNIQCTSHNICITSTDDRCSFENKLFRPALDAYFHNPFYVSLVYMHPQCMIFNLNLMPPSQSKHSLYGMDGSFSLSQSS